MQYEYDFEYMFPEMMEGAAEGAFLGAAGVFVGLFLLIYFLALAFSVVSYVLSAVGMYRIAKRRGIHHAWLSWVPVGNSWLLGSISDHYQYVAKQKVTRRRNLLLTLNLILLGATMAFAGGIAAAVALSSEAQATMAIALSVVSYLVVLGLSIAIMVITYIAYYDLFRSCKPGNSVLFLILSVVFNVTLPFFVFFISNSDEGMPQRRPRQPEQIPVEEPTDTPEEEPMQYEQIPVVEAEIVEDPE